jgi:hypothetical protein
VGDIRNNITSGSISANDTNSGVGGVFNNNAFSGNGINNSPTGQGGYNYPDTNPIEKLGYFIASDGTHAVWTTIDDYAAETAPDLAADYLFMWSDADQVHKKILLGDVGGSGGSGTTGQIALWSGSPAALTSSNLFTYVLGGGDGSAYFKVGQMADTYLLTGESTFYTNGTSIFDSLNNTEVWIKSKSDTSTHSPMIIMNRNKGMMITSTLPLLNDVLGQIVFNSGTGGSGTKHSASITVTAKENFVTAYGSSLSIETTKIGQSAKSERLLIDSDGSIKVTGQIYSIVPATTFPTANAIALDWNTGNGQIIGLTGATGTVTVTLANPKAGAVYLITIKQSSTIARNITWPLNIKWSGSVIPTITTALNAVDTAALFYDGTNYYANISQNYG